MHDGDAPIVGLLSEAVRLMGEEDGDRSHEDRQSLPRRSHQYSHSHGLVNSIALGDSLVDKHHGDNRGDRGRQSGVGRHGGTDVHPGQGDELEGSTGNDSDGGVAQGNTGQGAGDERAVELPLVQDAGHARDECHERDQNDLDQVDVLHGMSLSREG